MEDISRGCVITVRSTSAKNDGTGCGVLIDMRNGYVLTHSSILAPFLSNDHTLLRRLESTVSASSAKNGLADFRTEIIFENLGSKDSPESYSLAKYKTALVNSRNMERSSRQCSYSGIIRSVFKCARFEQVMKRMMPEGNWKFIDNSKDESDQKKNCEKETEMYEILPYFVLLKLQNWTGYDSVLRVRGSQRCQIGETVELLTTPFANLFPDIMLNSISRGIICNLAGKNQCLILSDARCLPGSEGSPLFTCGETNERYLTGLVVSSMCWKNGEWTGFSLACSVNEVLSNIPKLSDFGEIRQEIELKRTKQSMSDSARMLQSVLAHVSLIKFGPTWGSGIILGRNKLVITCSHVLKDSSTPRVLLKTAPRSELLECDILHQNPQGLHFDLAVLSCGKLHSTSKALQVAFPKQGSRAYVVGHAIFGDDLDLSPSVTSGVVSKVITFNNIPVMIQTTCAVHPGASGGALLDEDGRLLGIVVCNAKDSDSGASFPHVNMSIPAITIWPVIQKFLKNKDAQILKYLNIQNVAVDKLWALGKPASDALLLASGKPSRLLPSRL